MQIADTKEYFAVVAPNGDFLRTNAGYTAIFSNQDAAQELIDSMYRTLLTEYGLLSVEGVKYTIVRRETRVTAWEDLFGNIFEDIKKEEAK